MTTLTPQPDRLEHLMDAYTDALEAGRMQDAEAAILQFLALVAQTPNDPSPESLLLDEAQRCELTADWAGAEAAYEAFAESRSLRQAVGLPPFDRNEPTL